MKELFTIKQILSLKGIDCYKDKVKVARHVVRYKDNKIDITNEVYKKGLINTYQSFQSRTDFEDCKYIVSFIGTEETKAKFIGVYEVKNVKGKDMDKKKEREEAKRKFKYAGIPKEAILECFKDTQIYYYNLEKNPDFKEFEDRIIIEWGKAAIAWCQKLPKRDKEIIEILPKGYVKEFSGVLDFILTFDELKEIINHKESNKVWYNVLSSIDGVYLILDKDTNEQYIGSASGKESIWGRWETYVKPPYHGGNKKLRERLEKNPEAYKNWQFTLLHILSKKVVIDAETLYKKKLGSKIHGLNV